MEYNDTKSVTINDNLFYGEHHQEALEVELNVLRLLLKRFRLSHSPTKYFQRLSMLSRFLRNGPHLLSDLNSTESCPGFSGTNGVITWFNIYRDLKTSRIQLDKCITHDIEKKSRKKKRHDVLWDFADLSGVSADKVVDESEVLSQKIQQYNKRVLLLSEIFSSGTTEGVKRIEYAAGSLFAELSRGYFLPFGTVTIGCLARIRSLLISFGSGFLSELECSDIRLLPYSQDTSEIQLINNKIQSNKIQLLHMIEHSNQNSRPWDPLGITVTDSQRTVATLESMGLVSLVPYKTLEEQKEITFPQSSTAIFQESSGFTQQQANQLTEDQILGRQTISLKNVLDINSNDTDVGNLIVPKHSQDLMQQSLTLSKMSNEGKCNYKLDQNEDMLALFKQNEKKKRHQENVNLTTRSNLNVKKTAKKTKKTKKKGDFFDQLFG